MQIVNANTMFTLVSVVNEIETKNIVTLNLNRDNHKKYQLVLEGIKRKDLFLQKIKECIGNYIDIEALKGKKLDIWSDAYQLGIFEVEQFKEIVTEFAVEDWESEYKSLIDTYNTLQNKHSKASALWSGFIENLNFVLNKEVQNSKTKNEFLQKESMPIQANQKVIKLASKILNLVERYNIEIKENQKTY